jgi:hypothetical protein
MKLVFEGFVDYGEDDGFSEPITLKKHEGELADHALVLIFRPYRYSWIQPIAFYATKGACPGGDPPTHGQGNNRSSSKWCDCEVSRL